MTNIHNEAKIKNPLIVAIREQLEHRALWMFFLCDEARKKGLEPTEYAPAAIRRCGLYQGARFREKGGLGNSLRGLSTTAAACFWLSAFSAATFFTSSVLFMIEYSFS